MEFDMVITAISAMIAIAVVAPLVSFGCAQLIVHGLSLKRRAATRSTRSVEPSEDFWFDFTATRRIRSLDIVYTRAQQSMTAQQEQIKDFATRSTWLAATAAAVVALAVSRAQDIAQAKPGLTALLPLVLGTASVACAGWVALSATGLRAYRHGENIRRLRETILYWQPRHAQLQLLFEWQRAYEHNERVMAARESKIRWSTRLLALEPVMNCSLLR
jgi:hypothetical protein